jgi:hypothetical protein
VEVWSRLNSEENLIFVFCVAMHPFNVMSVFAVLDTYSSESLNTSALYCSMHPKVSKKNTRYHSVENLLSSCALSKNVKMQMWFCMSVKLGF